MFDCRDVDHSKRIWQHVQADSSGASSMSKHTTEDLGAECSSKKARLVSCRVYEVRKALNFDDLSHLLSSR